MSQRRWLRWIGGRQQSGYDKLLLFENRWWLHFDVWLLRFRAGAQIGEHCDPVRHGQHYRLNWIVKRAGRGGHFHCPAAMIDWPRLKLFRPDLHPHSVTRVETGSRYVLSVGWVRNANRRASDELLVGDEPHG